MIYPAKISGKLPQVGTTIFTKMSAMALEFKAINLSQGFPDFPVDQSLIESVTKHMLAGHNQYAPMAGLPELRETIADKMEKRFGVRYNPESEITVTAGATQGLATAITSIIREGDEVLIFTPAYDSYAPIVTLNGGIPVFIKLKFPDYHIDWDEVKNMVSHRTRLIIINNPHNPTGAVLKNTDLEQLERLISNTNIIVLADEVYEHIIFDGKSHQSVCKYPKLAERSLIVYSFGKTFHATGWKVGYIVAPENLMAEFRKVHQFEVFSVNTPVQWALAEHLADEKNWHIEDLYQRKRDRFLQAMLPSRFKAIPSSGTYFQLYDYSAISDMPDVEFAEWLTKEYGVACIPISVFYNVPTDNKVVRFCFAKQDETLDKAAERLLKV